MHSDTEMMNCAGCALHKWRAVLPKPGDGDVGCSQVAGCPGGVRCSGDSTTLPGTLALSSFSTLYFYGQFLKIKHVLQSLSIFTVISFFSPPTQPPEFKGRGELLSLADGKNSFTNEGPNFWGQVGGWGAEIGQVDEDLQQ